MSRIRELFFYFVHPVGTDIAKRFNLYTVDLAHTVDSAWSAVSQSDKPNSYCFNFWSSIPAHIKMLSTLPNGWAIYLHGSCLAIQNICACETYSGETGKFQEISSIAFHNDCDC